MDQSIKVPPNVPTVLDAGPSASIPGKPNCLTQITQGHRLENSEANYNQHQYNLSMQMLRKHEGLYAPLRMGMDLFAARKIGRLPFLPSSHVMEDVLLGRDEMIEFEDFLGIEEFNENLWQPHMVVEQKLGIL